MSDVKEIQIHATTEVAAEILRPVITISPEGAADLDSAFEKTIPAKWTVKDIKEMQQVVNTFEAAANLVVGEKSVDYFEAHPEAETVSGKTAVGRDTYNVSVARKQSVSAGIGAEAGRKTVYANVTSSIKGTNPEAKRVNQVVRSMGERLRES